MNRKGELFINDMDAFGMWGVCLSDSSLCSLVEPEPLKDAVSNKSSTEDGKQIRKEAKPKVDERDITLFVQLYATSRDDIQQAHRIQEGIEKATHQHQNQVREGRGVQVRLQELQAIQIIFQGNGNIQPHAERTEPSKQRNQRFRRL